MKNIELIKQLLFLLSLAFICFLLGRITKPQKDDTEKIQLKTEIVKLQYDTKIQEIENEYLRKLHFIENADAKELDSLWTSFDF